MPFMCGVCRLPEVQVSEKLVDGMTSRSVQLTMVDQSKRNLPQGDEKFAYTLEGAIKAGVARDKVNTIMLYPNGVSFESPQQQQQGSSSNNNRTNNINSNNNSNRKESNLCVTICRMMLK